MCRGFLTLSMSLGMMAAVLHAALLQSLRAEGDAAVVLGTLRALGTLLLAAPYHRLAPGLLLRCVQVGPCQAGVCVCGLAGFA